MLPGKVGRARTKMSPLCWACVAPLILNYEPHFITSPVFIFGPGLVDHDA